jgi:hypothetical protein
MDNPPLERTAAAVYFTCGPSVARAPPRPLNGLTLCGTEPGPWNIHAGSTLSAAWLARSNVAHVL